MALYGDLKKALFDWTNWFKEFSKQLVPRNDLPHFQEGLCLAMIGVRRSGKTSAAIQIAKELDLTDTTFYFNFEDPLFFSGGTVKDIGVLITLYEEQFGFSPTLVILDEVQNIEGWERWVRKAVDIGSYKVIVTGSSSQLLSSELATAISGRVIEHTIWPLSFIEYLSFRKLAPTSEGLWLRELDDYLRWGGFPKAALLKNENERILLLKQYLSDIVLRDVVSRHSIKSQHSLNQIVTWYLMGLGCLHSYTAIRKAFGISIELASTFTHYLNQAYLVFEMSRYHPNLKVQARDPKKIYMVDCGLRTVSLVSEREDWGHLAENVVYIELRRRRKEVYYFKATKEVDFIVTELGKPVEVIQVCYSNLNDLSTREREVNALMECLEAVKIQKGIILTRSYEHRETHKGREIAYVPLYQWLTRF